MCLIVTKPNKNASFSIADFKASQSRNSDGTGIMYVEDGRIKVEKTTGELKNHLELYYKNMHREQFVLHQRMATHGEKTELNVHPFKVLSLDDGDPYDLYFAHNGVISMNKFSKTADVKLSDTHLFAVEYLAPLMKKYPNIIEDIVFQSILHDFIGASNKLVFLRNDGNIWTFNKNAGDEHNGCWLSNKYSIASNSHNTYNYGKKHGVHTYNHNYESDDYYTDSYTNYFEENGLWREEWKEANKLKEKIKDTHTGLTINDLIENIEQHVGLTSEYLEEELKTDPYLIVDMLTILSPKEVNETDVLKEEPKKVADELYELLQSYAKKAA